MSTARALILADHCLASANVSNFTPPGAVTNTSSVGFDEWHELHLIWITFCAFVARSANWFASMVKALLGLGGLMIIANIMVEAAAPIKMKGLEIFLCLRMKKCRVTAVMAIIAIKISQLKECPYVIG